MPDANPPSLHGIKVLDLSRILAGPWCTQILADLGADVIKVERPGAGDDTRGWGPPFIRDAEGRETDQSTYYAACNRNKRSVTVDMAHPEGRLLLQRMAAEADVMVENFKAGGLARYGLDYASLRPAHPRLVYCSITGFGQDGPYAGRAGYDLLIQAMCGLMSITGRPDEQAGAGPLRVGVAVTDLFTGIYASTAIVAALRTAERTGEGQHIDMALLDVGMAVLANQATAFLNAGSVPGRQGNAHPSLAPYQDFPTSDGAMLLAIGNNGQFERFCHAAGRADLAEDPRFKTNTSRVHNREALIPMLEVVTVQRTTADWVRLLEHQAVPCGPINNIDQAFADPQVIARGLRVSQPRPGLGDGIAEIAGVASPLRLADTPPVLRHAPPALGQHTEEVLREFGLTAAEIARLRSGGAI